mmetsp:Transcript_9137/g.27013  ORF Transcript_9137/g.27013 Transcript_9137/m.27013 type:complete len:222 (+) Transcript_9137:552-1217(+)
MQLCFSSAVAGLHDGVSNTCLDILVCLLNLQRQENDVLLRLDRAVKPAEVGSAKASRLLEVVRCIPPLAASPECAAQGCPRRRKQKQRTEAVRAAAIARRVKYELHVLDPSSAERCAAHGLSGREAAPQQGRLFDAPLDAPDHSRAHDLHLLFDLVEYPVVDVPAKDNRPLQRLHRQFSLVGIRRRRRWLHWMLNLTDCLENLNAESECVVLSVDLVFQEA